MEKAIYFSMRDTNISGSSWKDILQAMGSTMKTKS